MSCSLSSTVAADPSLELVARAPVASELERVRILQSSSTAHSDANACAETCNIVAYTVTGAATSDQHCGDETKCAMSWPGQSPKAEGTEEVLRGLQYHLPVLEQVG